MARVLDIIIPATIPKHRKHIREKGGSRCRGGIGRRGVYKGVAGGLGPGQPGSAVAVDRAKVLWGA